MDLEGAGNGGKEQIELTENRVKLWTFVYRVKDLE
jgi:hypothetical protein